MRVLILTKNVSTENETQKMLQILGHEVFTTSKMLDLYLSTGDTMTATLFDLCIISKTISDYEANHLAAQLANRSCTVFREVERISDETIEYSKGPFKELKAKQTITDLREALAEGALVNQ